MSFGRCPLVQRIPSMHVWRKSVTMLAIRSFRSSRTLSSIRAFHSSPRTKGSGAPLARQVWSDHIAAAKTANTFKTERIITSPQSSSITVSTSSKPVLNFCANNYLGLANDPDLIEAAIKATRDYGFGLASVRFICGTQDLHKTLEQKISEFHKTEDTILYGSCFDANAGIFEGLLEDKDALFSDALNHASIIDGMRLSKAQKNIYKHMDMADLESKLKESTGRIKLIVTDGAFSMDGDIAPLDKICDLADKYNALVFIDECHATGFLGKSGRGTPEYFGVENRVDLINSTLGKALGGATGGYTTGKKEAIQLLRQKSRPYLFSNTLSPGVVGASIKVFEKLIASPELRDKLEKNTKLFRSEMTKAGFKLSGDPNHPIAPVMLGDAGLATNYANKLLEKGIYVIGFSFPVVPKGAARIRVQLSAAHSTEQVMEAVKAFTQVGKELGVIA